MQETDVRTYMSRKMIYELQIRSRESIMGTPLKKLGYGKDLKGKLVWDNGFFIMPKKGKKVKVVGDDTFLRDPAWNGRSCTEEILQRFDGKEVNWYGQSDGREHEGFIPYMAHVVRQDGINSFYVGKVGDRLFGEEAVGEFSK
jgi:hypothetical protein